MNDGTPLGGRVQKAFMAAVLKSPTKTNKQKSLEVSLFLDRQTK
jgi:hypothetical protein